MKERQHAGREGESDLAGDGGTEAPAGGRHHGAQGPENAAGSLRSMRLTTVGLWV
jgi:hypothetical protein